MDINKIIQLDVFKYIRLNYLIKIIKWILDH